MRSRKTNVVAEWYIIMSEQQEKTRFPRQVPILLEGQSQGKPSSWQTKVHQTLGCHHFPSYLGLTTVVTALL